MGYINKDILVAEIERRKKYYENIQMIKPVYESNIEDFNELLSFIDTLEVKEVDLEKELDFVKDAYYYFTSDERSSMKKVAKHFFELGMQQSKNHNNNEE